MSSGPVTSPPHSEAVVEPVSPQERIETLDILRGWAVFGIILADVDILFKITPGTDHVLNELHKVFVVGKFWPLFSFLFGLGFAMQISRAESRGHDFLALYRRRLLALLLFGLANALLLLHVWRGDILHRYALWGFLLLLFRRRCPGALLLAAALCLLIPRVYDAVIDGRHLLRLGNPQTAAQAVREEAQREATSRAWDSEFERTRRQGGYLALMKLRAKWLVVNFSSFRFYLHQLQFPFALFLIGLYAGRRQIFENLPANLPLVHQVMWWGLGLGLVGQLVWFVCEKLPNPAWPYFTRQVRSLAEPFADAALSFFYATAVVLLAQHPGWKKFLAPLAAPGRMALTNYLLQSVAFAILCPRYALGLFEQVRPAQAWGTAGMIFGLQLMLSLWWLGRFRFGPAEWLWRMLTYGKLRPMRIGQPDRISPKGNNRAD
ncbi:MAG: DUF418 domain-containing protein [Acidobacteria bacterium]|nr:DUF418 domain-containing protein [Acidobacteriota bacterium]